MSSLSSAPVLPVRARSQARLAAAALFAALIVSSVLFVAAASGPAHTLIRHPHTDAFPDWLIGPLGDLGLRMSVPQEGLLLIAMFAAYAALLVVVEDVSPRSILAAIVGLNVLFAIAPPLLSSDVFNYIDYGRLAVLHGLDPYRSAPAAIPGDAIYPFVGWRHTPTVYGPLFTFGTYPLALLSPAAALWSFKALAGLSSIAISAIVWAAAGRQDRAPAAAAAAVGLNPVMLVWGVGGAHNDVLMLAVLAGGAFLVLRSRAVAGGAALAGAVAVKATAGLALPFVLLGSQRRGRLAVGLAIGTAVSIAVAVFAFPDHALRLLQTLGHEQQRVAVHSVPNALARLFGQPHLTQHGRTITEIAFFAAIAVLMVRVGRGGDWPSAGGWALLALAATSAWFLPWYAIWPLPLAAIARDRRVLVATLALQAYVIASTAFALPGY